MRIWLFSFAVFVAVSTHVLDARAALLTVQFTATVTEVATVLGGGFSVGESVVGSFMVETADTNVADLDTGTYTATGLSLTVGGDYPLTALDGYAVIRDNFGGNLDVYDVFFSSGVVGTPVNGRLPFAFDIQLNLTPNTFLSDAYPLVVPLQQVTWDRSNMYFQDSTGRLSYEVNSITVVPEPTTGIQCVAALIALSSLLVSRTVAHNTAAVD
jgi:hypothetical protein